METNQELNTPVDGTPVAPVQNDTENNGQRPAEPQHMPNQPTYSAMPTQPVSRGNKGLLACNLVLLVGLVLLYIFHFTGIGAKSPNKVNPNASMPVIAEDGQLKIAFVDSDSLLAKYDYARDLEAELNAFKESQEKSYQQQMTKFQSDYQNYLKTGENMTLTQQQAKEEELKKRAEKMSTLEQELTAKIMERQINENTKLLNAIFAFVREYNAQNQQFDIIMRKTFENSPNLYLNPGMDITQEILDGLNEEYKNLKGKVE
jgi:outer membrane protein